MYVGSLFSGIGGIELGFEREGFETKWFVEQDKFCQQVLKKNFPNKPIYGDITKIDFNSIERVDILTGGFPCQDVSYAGKRKGMAGERTSLWKEYARAISEIRPRYAVMENVPGLISLGLDTVLGDLTKIGYDTEWTTLRASDFGALHKRERIFIIAYNQSSGSKFGEHSGRPINNIIRKNEKIEERKNGGNWFNTNSSTRNPSNSNGLGRNAGQNSESEHLSDNNWDSASKEERRKNEQHWLNRNTPTPFTNSNGKRHGRWSNEEPSQEKNDAEVSRRSSPRFLTDDWSERIQRFREESLSGEQGFSWCKDVRRIEDLKGRQDLPEPLFRGGRDGIPNWAHRIKSCGNAVVPQCAQFIARQIKEKEGD